jgi:hypothetical protein
MLARVEVYVDHSLWSRFSKSFRAATIGSGCQKLAGRPQ